MGRPSRTGVAWAAANYAATLPSNADPPYDDDESSYGSIDSMPDLLQRLTTHDDKSSCGSIDSIPVLLGGPSDIDDDESSCGSDDPMPPLEARPPPSSTSWPTHEELSRFLHPHTACAASDADCTRVMAIATNTILQAHDTIDDQPYFSLLRDWLIDSGASSHMTNDPTDLVLNVEESAAVVQVANGVLIRAQQRGTVRIRIQDLQDPHITCDILVHDVLHVPGLSRRLLSVDQWNASGGEMWFHPQHTALRAVDSDTGESHSFSVAKPFTLLRNLDGLPSASAQTEYNQNYRLQQEAHASIQSASIVSKKRSVSSDLLHRRLGHRTVNAIMAGSRNEVWADTTMRWEHDDFCDSCQVVTARLSNQGKSPLDVGHEEMAPGEYVMCDVVPNMNKRGLIASSHYKCYLLVTDVKSRFTLPIGITSPSSRNIADALLVWSRDYGPDVTFNLHDVLKLRADAAQAHFAAELTELLTEHRVKGTFAVPRHQN
jgi:hypothetical protein